MAWIRLVVYLAGLGGAALAVAGFADFDPATGDLAIHPFNLYAMTGAAGGALSSLVATVAWLKGWRGKQ